MTESLVCVPNEKASTGYIYHIVTAHQHMTQFTMTDLCFPLKEKKGMDDHTHRLNRHKNGIKIIHRLFQMFQRLIHNI